MRGGGGDLLRARLSQAGQDLILTVRTASPVPLAKLDPHPGGGAPGLPGSPSTRGGPSAPDSPSRYLCLGLTRAGARGERALCLGGRAAHRRVGLELRNAAGRVTREATLPARVKRPSPTKLVLAIDPASAGLSPGRYRWRVAENRRGCAAARCVESLPGGGANAFRLRPVRPVGCTGGSAGEDFEGPGGRPVVALTFDDGPSEYTEGFLDVLRAKHARGTFFEIGQEMPGREAAMRRILREGDEIGDHTMNHVEYPGYAQIAGAAARIRAYTHFEPCLFRPPGGADELLRRRHGGRARPAHDPLERRPRGLVAPPAPPPSTAASSPPRTRARSSSCTTAAATAAARSRRCRGSSTPCAPAATASPRSLSCSASG